MMKSWAWIVGLVSAVLVSVGCGGSSAGSGAEAEGAVSQAKASEGKTAPVWLTDFEKAKAESKARGVPILVDFSGSDWCGWCIKLDKEVFSQPAFQEYAGGNLVLLLVDFPSRKKLPPAQAEGNEKLRVQYGVEGFPTVLMLNADGKVIGRTGYRAGGAEAYIEHLKKLAGSKG